LAYCERVGVLAWTWAGLLGDLGIGATEAVS
jgi:hypothetical protein